MNRRNSLGALGACLASIALSASAQKPHQIPTVGLLMTTIGPDDALLQALRKGMRELGYAEGQNVRFEFRGAYGHVDRLAALAKELAELKVDVIVASPDPAVLAAKRAVNDVPIVMIMFTTDPVAARVIESFRRPGGNITGLYGRQSELVAKRLQLLQEAVPQVSRVGVLYDAPGTQGLADLRAAARALNIELVEIELKPPYDLIAAFNRVRDAKVAAVITLDLVPVYARRQEIAELALQRGLPSMAQLQQFPRAGGLMAYGTDNEAVFARVAYFIDRILRGVTPAELPVEQMTSFKLVVNLRTAKALGITIPHSILVRADEVIR